ncbi:MAG: hypothetical protein U9Q20_07730, partial [Campylobacterota bacterium]|nr:hypothetical protein [Campylobacterota bacterium]
GTVKIEAEGIDHITVTENSSGMGFGKEFTVTSVEGHIDSSNELQTAVLVDGVCEGVAYETTSGVTGTTDAEGNFSFREGDDVTFSVGGVTLGTATASDIESGHTFLQDIADVDRTDLNDEYLENMATFLQSVDTPDSGDNIVITPEVHAALADADIDLRTASEQEVADLVESIGATYVEEDVAMEHVQEMLEEYAGMDESEFDEHIDDSLQTATFGTEAPVGVTYTTSSGVEGTIDSDGVFTYDEGDDITFFDANGDVISTINGSDIGSDNFISMGEIVSLGETIDTDVVESEQELSIVEVDGQDVTDGKEATITDTNGNVLGVAIVNNNGEVEFTPSEFAIEMNGSESSDVSFEYTVSDGTDSDTAELTVSVDGDIDANVDDTVESEETSDIAEDEFDLDFDESTIAGFEEVESEPEVAVEEEIVQEDVSEDTETSVIDNEAFDLDFDNLANDIVIDENIDEVDSTESEIYIGDVIDTSAMDSDVNTDFFDAPEASALDTNIPTEDVVAPEASDFVSGGDSGIEEVQVILDTHVQVDQS